MLRDAEIRLKAVGVDGPRRDAQVMMAEVFGCDRSRLVLMDSDVMTSEQTLKFNSMVAARCRRQPLSQVIGYREFWGRRFSVTSDVLDPRPDTELIVELALNGAVPETLLDLCTGSGNLAVTLLCEWRECKCVASDISQIAIDIARINAVKHGVDDRLELKRTSWFDDIEQKFDLLVANPPYISDAEMPDLADEVRLWEPAIALTPGGDGLSAYRLIASELENVLNPEGRALLEFGSTQAEAVSAIFHDAGYSDTRIHRDLGGKDRVISISHKF